MTAFCDPLYDFRNSEDPEYCLLQKLLLIEGTGTSYTSSDQTCICQWAFQSIALYEVEILSLLLDFALYSLY